MHLPPPHARPPFIRPRIPALARITLSTRRIPQCPKTTTYIPHDTAPNIGSPRRHNPHLRIRSLSWRRKMERPPSERLDPIPATLPHRLRHPVLPTARRNQRSNLLLEHTFLQIARIRPAPISTHVRVPADVVLFSVFHPLVPHRPDRSAPVTTLDDIPHVCSDGRSNRTHLQRTEQTWHRTRAFFRSRSSSHAIHL